MEADNMNSKMILQVLTLVQITRVICNYNHLPCLPQFPYLINEMARSDEF